MALALVLACLAGGAACSLSPFAPGEAGGDDATTASSEEASQPDASASDGGPTSADADEAPVADEASVADEAEAAPAEPPEHDVAYTILTEPQQAAYARLLPHLLAGEESFDVRPAEASDVAEAYMAIIDDHPEVFWTNGLSYSYVGKTVTVKPDLSCPPDEAREASQVIAQRADELLAEIPADLSTYDKVRYLYEWTIFNTYYEPGPHDQTIQGVLVDGRAVCAGYARTFQYLCHRLGIPCALVNGKLDEGDYHSWCLVTIDGTPTYVDVTWGDPDASAEGSGWETFPEGINYDYLCLTTDEIGRDRTIDRPASGLPACDSRAYDTYVLAGRYLEYYDWETYEYLLDEALWSGEGGLAVKFGSAEAAEAAYAYLESTDAFYGSLGATEGYQYSLFDTLNIVRVWW